MNSTIYKFTFTQIRRKLANPTWITIRLN